LKLELFSSAMAGVLGAVTAMLTSYGTSWPVVAVVFLGVAMALLEEEELSWRPAVVVSVFNMMIGVLGGPLAAQFIGNVWGVDIPALTLIIAFLVAYVAHDFFSKARAPLMGLLVKVISAFGGQKS
jgi:hypothetical protein